MNFSSKSLAPISSILIELKTIFFGIREYQYKGNKQHAKSLLVLVFGLFLSLVLSACTDSTKEQVATSSQSKNQKVIIIGAGISGLSAGKYLQDNGYQPTILEAQDKVGGRIKTDRSLGVPFDEGASWIHNPRGNPITPIAQQSGAETYMTDDFKVKVYDIDGNAYPDQQLTKAERQFNQILNSFDGNQKNSFADVFYNDYPQYKNDRLWTYMLSAFLEFDTGGDIKELSSSGFYDDETFAGKDVIITNGYDHITDKLAQGLDIKLNTRVNAINYKGQKIEIATNNGTYQADKVLVTVPLGVLKKGVIDFIPALPEKTQQAIDGLQMGSVNKFLLIWDNKTLAKPFWEDDLQYIGFTPKEKGKFNYFLNVDKLIDPSLGKYALMTFAFGDYSKQTEQMSDKEITDEIMSHLQAIYGKGQYLPRPTGFLRTKWNENPNSYGSYSFSTVGISNNAFEAFETPVNDKIFFAGEHTVRDYRGTAHGAYLSGVREAKKITALDE